MLFFISSPNMFVGPMAFPHNIILKAAMVDFGAQGLIQDSPQIIACVFQIWYKLKNGCKVART